MLKLWHSFILTISLLWNYMKVLRYAYIQRLETRHIQVNETHRVKEGLHVWH